MGRLQRAKAAKTAPKQDSLQRMIDREAKRAEGKGAGYDRWAALHNLKQMAATVNLYQEYGFSSPEELDEALTAAHAALQDSTADLKTLEATLKEKKELHRQLSVYIKTRPAREGIKAQKSEKARAAYRQAHEGDFLIAEAAARYFKEQGMGRIFPFWI